MQKLYATKLENLPHAIALQERKVARLREQLKTLKEAVAREEAQVDKMIAFDPDLKNDAQRKARRAELLDESDILRDLRISINKDEGRLRDAEIDLDLFRNQFAILKLQKREEIAERELAARAAS